MARPAAAMTFFVIAGFLANQVRVKYGLGGILPVARPVFDWTRSTVPNSTRCASPLSLAT